ncbi:flagellar type III secretion system pore protein FliP [Pyrinomonas methylaliphatogenes]|jgi:flagellar biosynthetic protein FliP|uniref:Flagellar biosynthetic protein FliP n=1 Tax=Pyrinomonas methylaliphatogenes TaxID=454194 RepID=A0A0B6WZC2_9BACT|nr:flagellar type III secretion system pore protein FliP [Pyrinomonas methylaliphatogenes]MBX5478954.1 flagellar type III secretion system pore protein FliP [Pyrinomonas methylaliphatogenes]CDM65629.1 flagellar biosynthetic protein FliP [Pyrinomonas methylaliphatogenes]
MSTRDQNLPLRLSRPLALAFLPLVLPFSCLAAATDPNPQLNLTQNNALSLPIQIVLILTLLSFIPAILISMTCFTRLIVVFHFLRQALGTTEAPNNQVLLGLALFLTMFVMGPVFARVHTEALAPLMAGQISHTEALTRALVPLRAYMLKHTRERDLALFIQLSGSPRPRTPDDVPTTALVPAYMISELKTAFQIGFVLFIPFLIIDMAVSSVLLSMGMMQLPPVIISMPLKILLFVMVDGWYLIVGSLVRSVM